MNKEILFTVSGPDHPGITSKLMDIIVSHKQDLIDIGQSVTHGLLSLSFVVNVDDSQEDSLIKELLFATTKMDLRLDYQDIKSAVHKEKQNHREQKYILNCVSTKAISAEVMKVISQCFSKHGINIRRIDNITPRGMKALELLTTISKDINIAKVKEELLSLSTRFEIDLAFIKDDAFRRSRRLIVMDMDSTLIQTEVIDELADACGVKKQVSAITEDAMNGKIDFNQSLTQRVSFLEGLEEKKMKDILASLPLTQGVETFIQTVKSLGYKVALISGGFSYFANALKEKLDLDYAFSNELELVEGKLTGKLKGAIIDANQKALILKMIAQQEKISLEQVVAIGDGANDLEMLSTAGLGIAFHAKEIVRQEANQHMSHGPMTTILYFLGIDQEVELSD